MATNCIKTGARKHPPLPPPSTDNPSDTTASKRARTATKIPLIALTEYYLVPTMLSIAEQTGSDGKVPVWALLVI